jgi:hypothetical protein
MNEWMGEWMSEWVNEWVFKFMLHLGLNWSILKVGFFWTMKFGISDRIWRKKLEKVGTTCHFKDLSIDSWMQNSAL